MSSLSPLGQLSESRISLPVLVFAYSLLRWRAGPDTVTGLAVMAAAITVIVGVDFPGVAETVASPHLGLPDQTRPLTWYARRSAGVSGDW